MREHSMRTQHHTSPDDAWFMLCIKLKVVQQIPAACRFMLEVGSNRWEFFNISSLVPNHSSSLLSSGSYSGYRGGLALWKDRHKQNSGCIFAGPDFNATSVPPKTSMFLLVSSPPLHTALLCDPLSPLPPRLVTAILGKAPASSDCWLWFRSGRVRTEVTAGWCWAASRNSTSQDLAELTVCQRLKD